MDHEQQPADDERGTDTDHGIDEERSSDAAFEPVPPENDEATAELDDSDAPIQLDDLARDPVRAENVTLQGGGAQSIEASTVSITQGGAARVNADQLSVEQGGVGFARTESLTVSSEASAFAVYAENATVEPDANVFILIARSVQGEVRPVFDWRAALALGGGFALVLAILRRLR